jgi:hypothetical protein
MQGQNVDKDPSVWYVPVIVSNGRQDTDKGASELFFVLLAVVADIDDALIKAGNPSIVFDCIYNPSIKSRTLRDPDFKLFIIGPFSYSSFFSFLHLSFVKINQNLHYNVLNLKQD